jgi:hypothetical protein
MAVNITARKFVYDTAIVATKQDYPACVEFSADSRRFSMEVFDFAHLPSAGTFYAEEML